MEIILAMFVICFIYIKFVDEGHEKKIDLLQCHTGEVLLNLEVVLTFKINGLDMMVYENDLRGCKM